MSDIKWEDGAVCFAGGKQWDADNDLSDALNLSDFQLNEIRRGDYVASTEINKTDDFDSAVEVFGLFGFYFEFSAEDTFNSIREEQCIFSAGDNLILYGSKSNREGRELTFNQLMAIGKLKRAMIERDKSNASELPDSSEPKKDGNKYHRTIYGLCGTAVKVDVYRVSDAFPTGSAPIDHAVKKMLCAGLRGHKDKLTDYDNAIESLQSAKELLIQKSNNENTN